MSSIIYAARYVCAKRADDRSSRLAISLIEKVLGAHRIYNLHTSEWVNRRYKKMFYVDFITLSGEDWAGRLMMGSRVFACDKRQIICGG